MSRAFPNEAQLEKSEHSGDPIRGGSMAINRILGYFVDHAEKHHNPAFTACLLSAFTILRNVHGTLKTENIDELEQAFVKDVQLFMEYYNTYLGFVKSHFTQNKKACVVVYFPTYDRIAKEMRLEPNRERSTLAALYKRFLARTTGRDEKVMDLEHVSCFWMRAGDGTYPHREVASKFRQLVISPTCLYRTGDPIAMVSHVAFDFHIMGRVRGIMLLESHTGLLRPGSDIKARIDNSGIIPFMSVTHGVFGDKTLLQSQLTPKLRKQLRAQAEEEKWTTRSEDDIRNRISKTTGISVRDLRKFDFV